MSEKKNRWRLSGLLRLVILLGIFVWGGFSFYRLHEQFGEMISDWSKSPKQYLSGKMNPPRPLTPDEKAIDSLRQFCEQKALSYDVYDYPEEVGDCKFKHVWFAIAWPKKYDSFSDAIFGDGAWETTSDTPKKAAEKLVFSLQAPAPYRERSDDNTQKCDASAKDEFKDPRRWSSR